MDRPREPKNKEEIEQFLDSTSGERGVVEYLQQYPFLLFWAFCTPGGHARYVFREFPLGSRFKADVVVLNGYSGAWEVHFVELEPVDDMVMTKQGTPSARLSGAIKQVDDWRQYIKNHASEVRQDLVRWAKNRDLLGYSSPGEPCTFSSDYLHDMNTVVLEYFHIVIGRSSKMSVQTQSLMGRTPGGHDVKLTTYDRFVRIVADRQVSRECSSR